MSNPTARNSGITHDNWLAKCSGDISNQVSRPGAAKIGEKSL